jgi:hypothetical protein
LQGIDPAPTYTRAHLVLCEVRTVLSWPIEDRRDYLVRVEKSRGAHGRKALEAAILAEFEARRIT